MNAMPMRSPLPSTEPSLWSLVLAACRAGAGDPLLPPVGGGSRDAPLARVSVTLAVLRMAVAVEPDPAAVMEWYRWTPITALGNLSAEQLVALGGAEMVVAFLRAVREDMGDDGQAGC